MTDDEFYEIADASTIRRWKVDETFDKTMVQDEITVRQTLLALSTEAKEKILEASPLGTVENLDALWETELAELTELLNYWDYDTDSLSFTGAKSIEITPTVHSQCGQDSGQEATKCVDGNLGTQWAHTANEAHWIIFDLGAKKMVKQIQVYLPPSASNEYKLEDVNVYVGDDTVTMVQVGSLLDFQTDDDWNETDITPTSGRYVKLENIGTLHATNLIRVREVQIQVIPFSS